jgi:hypothetical protein
MRAVLASGVSRITLRVLALAQFALYDSRLRHESLAGDADYDPE